MFYSELAPTNPWCNMLCDFTWTEKIWGGYVRWTPSRTPLFLDLILQWHELVACSNRDVHQENNLLLCHLNLTLWSNGLFFGWNIINSVFLTFKESLLVFKHWERFLRSRFTLLAKLYRDLSEERIFVSSGIFYAVMKIIDVNKEKKRTKNRAFRNSCQDCLNCRIMVINWYKLFSIEKIRTEPYLCNASYPIVLKFPNKHLMINRIKYLF